MSTVTGMPAPTRVSDPRRLLVERAAVLLRRVFRAIGRGWARWRAQAERHRRAASHRGVGTGLGAVMGRALAGRGPRSRKLAVEERLTLGPKQHMYLIRCGEQRLLVASAGDAALQWMTLPDEDEPGAAETCDNTLLAEGKATARRRDDSGAKTKRIVRSGTRKSGAAKAAAGGAR